MDDESQTLLLMMCVPWKELVNANLNIGNDLDLIYASLEPVTHTIMATLWHLLSKQMQAKQLKVFNSLAHIKCMRHLMGLLFELLAQSELQVQIKLKLVPMGKKELDTSSQSPQWLTDCRDITISSPIQSINITPAKVVTYSVLN
ncbi:hypothetical protein EI94DRAFT_1704336 [Lactarius quietus]|nr:hypothetical protein EI94DRAFT_1704336 [Lactarius quietus]